MIAALKQKSISWKFKNQEEKKSNISQFVPSKNTLKITTTAQFVLPNNQQHDKKIQLFVYILIFNVKMGTRIFSTKTSLHEFALWSVLFLLHKCWRNKKKIKKLFTKWLIFIIGSNLIQDLLRKKSLDLSNHINFSTVFTCNSFIFWLSRFFANFFDRFNKKWKCIFPH